MSLVVSARRLCINKYSTNDLPWHLVTISQNGPISTITQQDMNDLNLTKNKKSFPDHGIQTRGPILWNSLSKPMKESKSVKHFRN